MTRFIGDKMTNNRDPQQRKIADRIEDLVFHEFVRKPETVLVDDPMLIQNDGVLQGSPEGQTLRLKIFDISGMSNIFRRRVWPSGDP